MFTMRGSTLFLPYTQQDQALPGKRAPAVFWASSTASSKIMDDRLHKLQSSTHLQCILHLALPQQLRLFTGSFPVPAPKHGLQQGQTLQDLPTTL